MRALARGGSALEAIEATFDPEAIHDPTALGKAIKRALSEQGVTVKPPVAIAIPRTEAVLKPIELPADAALEAGDRPSFVRLQLGRHLPFPSTDAAIDFVQSPSDPPALLGAAMRDSRAKHLMAAAKVAGLGEPTLVLVDEGHARVLESAVDGLGGGGAGVGQAVLGIALADTRCEIVLAREGRLLMSRTAEVATAEQGLTFDSIEAAITEARRTLMSYRVRSDAVAVAGVCVLGNGELADALARDASASLSLPRLESGGEAATLHPAYARLAGVFDLGEDTIDFAHPTRPPDRTARTRQLAMLAVLILVAFGGGLFTLGLRDKSALEAEVTPMRGRLGELTTTARKAVRTSAQVDHARAWLATNPDWLAHLEAASTHLPAADRAILDRVEMQARMAMDYDSRSRQYDPEAWRSAVRSTLSLVGRAASGDVAVMLREALVADERYLTRPMGDDGAATTDDRYPAAFGLELVSDAAAPPVAPGADEATGEQGGDR